MIVALAFTVGGCLSAAGGAVAPSANLGTNANPIRVDMPAGERAYLQRLRCSDGAAPAFERLGSAGGARDGHILDIYVVHCAAGEPRTAQLWMDMYHPAHDETGAPAGFTLAPR